MDEMEKITFCSACTTCCEICNEQKTKYTCPRCGIQYCSVTCYKSSQHIQCSEFFFKDCVVKELVENKMQKQFVQKALPNLENPLKKDTARYEDDLDSDDSRDGCHENLLERMKNVDLNDSNAVWALLTEKERIDFKQKLFSGEVVKLLPNWTPWWIRISKISSEEIAPESMEIPRIKNKIPLLSSIMRKKTDEKVTNGLGNILYGYACASRLFMQDWTGNVNFAIETILEIATILCSNECFETADEALNFAHFCAKKFLNVSDELNLLVRNDVKQILMSQKFSLAALSDISALLHKSANDKCASIKRLHIAIKKIDFYLSFVYEYHHIILKCN